MNAKAKAKTPVRGRPAQGQGLALDDIVETALALLDEAGEQKLTMRALASRLGVTPMSLYHHVEDRAGLLRALANHVYAGVEKRVSRKAAPVDQLSTLLTRYHAAVCRHPQLTLAIFAEPGAFAGVTQELSARLLELLEKITPEPVLWRDILVDHAHGSALAFVSVPADAARGKKAAFQTQYQRAMHQLLAQLPTVR